MPRNCRRAYRHGQVCAEAAANQVEVMRCDLSPLDGEKGQIMRNRGERCQGCDDFMVVEGRWVMGGICQD